MRVFYGSLLWVKWKFIIFRNWEFAACNEKNAKKSSKNKSNTSCKPFNYCPEHSVQIKSKSYVKSYTEENRGYSIHIKRHYKNTKIFYSYETANNIAGQKSAVNKIRYINGDWASGIGELGGMGGLLKRVKVSYDLPRCPIS
jgi:hypothetical protein